MNIEGMDTSVCSYIQLGSPVGSPFKIHLVIIHFVDLFCYYFNRIKHHLLLDLLQYLLVCEEDGSRPKSCVLSSAIGNHKGFAQQASWQKAAFPTPNLVYRQYISLYRGSSAKDSGLTTESYHVHTHICIPSPDMVIWMPPQSGEWGSQLVYFLGASSKTFLSGGLD